jgi:AcrR family transcriptional regulator
MVARTILKVDKLLNAVYCVPPFQPWRRIIMGIAERRERERVALRTRIVEAARDIVSGEGLDALSMRAIAERIEYSPATLYLYFRDKDEILREVVAEGFRRLGEESRAQLGLLGEDSDPAERHRSLGRAYARFALENTAYFRVMFELPSVARVTGSAECGGAAVPSEGSDAWCILVETLRRAIDEGRVRRADPAHAAFISWGLLHGLTSLYLGGHLSRVAGSQDEFFTLVEEAMETMRQGFRPDGADESQAAPAP